MLLSSNPPLHDLLFYPWHRLLMVSIFILSFFYIVIDILGEHVTTWNLKNICYFPGSLEARCGHRTNSGQKYVSRSFLMVLFLREMVYFPMPILLGKGVLRSAPRKSPRLFTLFFVLYYVASNFHNQCNIVICKKYIFAQSWQWLVTKFPKWVIRCNHGKVYSHCHPSVLRLVHLAYTASCR